MPLFRKFFLPALLLTSALALGGVAGTYLYESREMRCEKSYHFINAEVVCDKKPVLKKTGYAERQNRLELFIAEEKAKGRATEVGVYFRDLRNGPVFGIDENADFAPASLLKLPLALVYLTQAERYPDLLAEELSVAEPTWSFTEHFPSPAGKINPKEPHTVDDLLMHMLKHSDNDAYGVLQTHLYQTGKKDIMVQTFLELGFINPSNSVDEVLSVRRYASIFRALYNVSYLNVEHSEKVLDWLVRSDFDQGLVAGVPEDVVVAHKFGERFTKDGTKQLHDCGIIYYPQNPYLLCVMTKGMDFDDLTKIIRHISQEVYEEVNSRRL